MKGKEKDMMGESISDGPMIYQPCLVECFTFPAKTAPRINRK
jgi:hypothetical protein